MGRAASRDDQAPVVNEVGGAYMGAAWVEGPGPVYDILAAEILSAGSIPLRGLRILDMGAGAGAVSRAAAAAGARPVAVDASVDMLRHDQRLRPPAAVGDALRLPFKDGAFHAVVAAFVLSHVPDPVGAVEEARRATKPGGAILVASFSSRSSHPSKTQVEDVAAHWGWRAPAWYQRLKSEFEPRVSSPEALAGLARGAGLDDVDVEEREVTTGIASTDAIVAWRLGMAHLAPFVTALPGARRGAFIAEARAAVGDRPQPLRPVILILSSRVPAQPERRSA